MALKTISNTELIPHIFGYEVILFPMGINNAMNSGFAYEIALNFPEVRESENLTNYGDKRKLVTIHETEVDGIAFCACYIHNGGHHKKKDGSYVEYQHISSCIEKVKEKYSNRKIATIVIGGNKTDGNGDREKIAEMIKEKLQDCKDVTIYDYTEEEYRTKIFKEIAALHKRLVDKEIDGKDFIKRRSEIEWRRRYGLYKPMPEDYEYYPRQEKSKVDFIGKIKKK